MHIRKQEKEEQCNNRENNSDDCVSQVIICYIIRFHLRVDRLKSKLKFSVVAPDNTDLPSTHKAINWVLIGYRVYPILLRTKLVLEIRNQ